MEFNYGMLSGENMDLYGYMMPEWILERKAAEYAGCMDDDGTLVGVLAYELHGLTAELLYVCTLPYKRGQGIASGLIRYFINVLDHMELPLSLEMVWEKDDDAVMRELLKGYTGIHITEKQSILRISYDRITDSQACRKMKELKEPVTCISYLPPQEHKQYLGELEAKGLDVFIPDDRRLVDDLCLCMTGNSNETGQKEVKALIYVEKVNEKTLNLAFLYSAPKNVIALAALLGEAMRRIEQKYIGMDIEMMLVNDQAKRLAANIFGSDLEYEPLYEAVRYGRF